MKASKGYIPILITLALVSLIGLQIVWLFFVYQYKKQELADNTREAVLEVTDRLKRNEDSRFILNNIDSLISKNSVSPLVKADLQFVVANIKNKLKIDSLDMNEKNDREIRIVNDTSTTTTVVHIDSGKKQKIIIRSETHVKGNPKRKAKELEELFLKMAISAEKVQKNIDERVDTIALKKLLKDALLERGIDLVPQYGITFFPRKHNSIPYHIVFNTPGYVRILPAMVNVELFPGDVAAGMLYFKLGYNQSTNNFVIKKMAGLLALSLSITILIGFVMIYIFRRMLSQDKLYQLKNDFINNMTHELKTPIATISLAIEAINNPQIKIDNEKFNNYTRILKEENQKLNGHVERVLQMALIDKGELRLNKKQINLVSIIESSIKSYSLQIEKQKAKVEFNRDQKEILITGDELHLQSLFNNLLDNALKYSKENCVISIHLEQNINEATVCFRDNGIGMDALIQDKVFDKFFRAQGGNLHDVKGFGLGLSYVKSIIIAHGGTIELKSEKGTGSEFIIKLPNAKG